MSSSLSPVQLEVQAHAFYRNGNPSQALLLLKKSLSQFPWPNDEYRRIRWIVLHLEGLHRQGTERDQRPVPEWIWTVEGRVERAAVASKQLRPPEAAAESTKGRLQEVTWNSTLCPASSPRVSDYGLCSSPPCAPAHPRCEVRCTLGRPDGLTAPAPEHQDTLKCPVSPQSLRLCVLAPLCLVPLIGYCCCLEGSWEQDVWALGLSWMRGNVCVAVEQSLLQAKALRSAHFRTSNLKTNRVASLFLVLLIFLLLLQKPLISIIYFNPQGSCYVQTPPISPHCPYTSPDVWTDITQTWPENPDSHTVQRKTPEIEVFNQPQFPQDPVIPIDSSPPKYPIPQKASYSMPNSSQSAIEIDLSHQEVRVVGAYYEVETVFFYSSSELIYVLLDEISLSAKQTQQKVDYPEKFQHLPFTHSKMSVSTSIPAHLKEMAALGDSAGVEKGAFVLQKPPIVPTTRAFPVQATEMVTKSPASDSRQPLAKQDTGETTAVRLSDLESLDAHASLLTSYTPSSLSSNTPSPTQLHEIASAVNNGAEVARGLVGDAGVKGVEEGKDQENGGNVQGENAKLMTIPKTRYRSSENVGKT